MELKAKLESAVWDSRKKKAFLTFSSDFFPEALEGEERDLRLTVVLWKEKRSRDANAMFWACVGELADALHLGKWDVYRDLIQTYGPFEPVEIRTEALDRLAETFRVVENAGETRPGYCTVLCYWGSHTYDTAEFSKLLDGTIKEMKDAGLQPPPSEDMRRSLERWEEEHQNGETL